MTIPSENLSIEQLEKARAELQQRLQNLEYFEAAQLLLWIGEKSKDLGPFVEAVKCFLIANCYQAARELCVTLCDSGVHNSNPELIKMFALAAALSGADRQSRELLALIPVNEEKDRWVNVLLQSSQTTAEALVSNTCFQANINNAIACSKANRASIVATIQCSACGGQSNTSMQHTIFRVAFTPCPYCLHPYVVTPCNIRDALWRYNPNHDEATGIKIDELLAEWVLNFDINDCPAAAIAWDQDLFSLSYFTNRYELGEVYSRLHAMQTNRN